MIQRVILLKLLSLCYVYPSKMNHTFSTLTHTEVQTKRKIYYWYTLLKINILWLGVLFRYVH